MEQHTGNERDLAGAGGGNIPSKGEPQPVMEKSGFNTSDKAVDADNASNQSAQGTLGGRNPGQLNKNIGDMDRPREHSDIENTPVDPMVSRAPDKVNAQQREEAQQKEKEQQKADQDKDKE
ncbi:hypothetical protein KDA_17300 [Dictyobacter alpinus]|uniref:Uncharacterized protein n=1 Tax=Dictyobacter alpinus TaxID=2014873 RepID=A0A402B4H4_9CHLR|nr:hypothetical protein [Dictyobacter alpinus]GCE26246.1 hypothetical protein KDA_17300 [Dictyobacter alpinus]